MSVNESPRLRLPCRSGKMPSSDTQTPLHFPHSKRREFLRYTVTPMVRKCRSLILMIWRYVVSPCSDRAGLAAGSNFGLARLSHALLFFCTSIKHFNLGTERDIPILALLSLHATICFILIQQHRLFLAVRLGGVYPVDVTTAHSTCLFGEAASRCFTRFCRSATQGLGAEGT